MFAQYVVRTTAVVLAALVGTFSATAQQNQDGDRDRQRERERERREVREGAPTLAGINVAILVGEGFHDLETLVPIGYLTNRGANVTVIGVEPGLVTAYNSEMQVRVERAAEYTNLNRYHALVIPGGQSPATLREHSDVVDFARQFYETERPVAAICHGPQVLVEAGVLDGVTATCYRDVRSELEEAGATFEDKEVVRDGHLVTSRVPDDLPAFCAAFEELLLESRRRPVEPRTVSPRTPN